MTRKEQIELEIEKLQNELKELEKEVVWKPKESEKYWGISYFGEPTQDINNNCAADEKSFACFNHFKTKEDAEKVSKVQTLYRAMWHWNQQNDNGYEFKYGGINYCILYIRDEGGYKIGYFNTDIIDTQVYFSSEKKAQACLDWLFSIGLLEGKKEAL